MPASRRWRRESLSGTAGLTRLMTPGLRRRGPQPASGPSPCAPAADHRRAVRGGGPAPQPDGPADLPPGVAEHRRVRPWTLRSRPRAPGHRSGAGDRLAAGHRETHSVPFQVGRRRTVPVWSEVQTVPDPCAMVASGTGHGPTDSMGRRVGIPAIASAARRGAPSATERCSPPAGESGAPRPEPSSPSPTAERAGRGSRRSAPIGFDAVPPIRRCPRDTARRAPRRPPRRRGWARPC